MAMEVLQIAQLLDLLQTQFIEASLGLAWTAPERVLTASSFNVQRQSV